MSDRYFSSGHRASFPNKQDSALETRADPELKAHSHVGVHPSVLQFTHPIFKSLYCN